MAASIEKPARLAVVTGGMGGLGTALCQHLAKSGLTVVERFGLEIKRARRRARALCSHCVKFDFLFGETP